MKQIFVITSLTFFLTYSYANTLINDTNDVHKALNKAGFAIQDTGINIVPLATMNSVPKELKKEWIQQEKEQKKNGYYHEITARPNELLNMHNEIALEYNKYKKNKDPLSTHMRHTIDEIKMAYPFKEVPKLDISNLIGFAPAGGYQDGWTGVVEFFDKKDFGSCAYTENNMKLSHGAEKIAEEMASFQINGKITTLEVKGAKTTGFLYTVYWSDKEFFRQLECANKIYSDATTQSVIALAQRIDAQ